MKFSWLLANLILIVTIVIVDVFHAAPSCVCDKWECETLTRVDCPGKGVLVWDPCRCCQECARLEGQVCGGEQGFSGTCEPGLICQYLSTQNMEGICRKGLLNSTDD